MLNQTGLSPSFKSTVIIDRKNFTDRLNGIADGIDFTFFTDALGNNGKNELVRIYSPEDKKDTLSMDIVEQANDGFDNHLLVIHDDLYPGEEVLDMIFKYGSHSGRFMEAKKGKFPNGGTCEFKVGKFTDYMA